MMKQLVAVVAVAVVMMGAAMASPYIEGHSLPLEGLGQYSAYREALLGHGWQPVAQENSVDVYPEVVCGNAVCTADWRSPDGREVGLSLWLTFPYPDERLILVVAPDYEEL